MHESSLARQLLAAVLQRAELAGAARVVRVRGWLAETEALDRSAIAFHFAGCAQGTPAENAGLELALIHTRARCNACGIEYPPEHHLTLCPGCGSTDAELLGPTGLCVESMDVE